MLASAVPACGGNQGPQKINLPAPSERSDIGPGDVFVVEVMGEKDLPKQYQVASDGTVDFPFIHTIMVAGLEPAEVARLIRKRLVEDKILADPAVLVEVKEYRSRKVTVLGQVGKVGSYPFIAGLTLVQLISLAGGLTSLANANQIHLTRTGVDGKTYTAVFSVSAMIEGRAPDVPLQSGDRVFVQERLF